MSVFLLAVLGVAGGVQQALRRAARLHLDHPPLLVRTRVDLRIHDGDDITATNIHTSQFTKQALLYHITSENNEEEYWTLVF